MLKYFVTSDTVAVEVHSLIYRNSRVLVLENTGSAALRFEVRIDCAREPIRFKTDADALDYAKEVVDTSRRALARELKAALVA